MIKAEIKKIAKEEAKAALIANREKSDLGYCGNERFFDNSANDAEYFADLAADQNA